MVLTLIHLHCLQYNSNLILFIQNGASTPAACGDDTVGDNARDDIEEIFIPNGFSPDGDGADDTWHITGIDRFNHVEIYSRWN